MLNYSTVLNDIITKTNEDAVALGEDSFVTSVGSTVTISQSSFTDIVQNQEVIVTHAADVSGTRLVNVIELVSGSTYVVKYNDTYEVYNLSSTQTRIKKLSSGTNSIKVNIVV